MKLESLGKLISKISPLNLIVEKNKVLWLSPKLGELLGQDFKLEKLLEEGVFVSCKHYPCHVFELEPSGARLCVFDRISRDERELLFAYEEILEALNDGVLLTDSEGQIIIYNKAMEELEKRDKKDMLGKKIWNAYGYKDSEKSEHMRVQRTSSPILDEYKAHAYQDGRPIYKSYSTLPIKKDDGVWGVFSISRDESRLRSLLTEITDLRRSFNEIKAQDRRISSNGTRYSFSDIVGSSKVMTRLIEEAQALAWLDNSLLLVGDTGTGKEVFAQSIHNFGKRREEAFIGINCSAIPENLLESILFGTVKGAYTGALDASGLFEEAGRGTLFLDELQAMPLTMQSKLLRALQEKTVTRLGGKEPYEIRCRVVSGMNQDPYKLMEKGQLRQDLFYRIAGYNLYIPRLMEREDDIIELTKYYINRYNISMNKNVSGISAELRNFMLGHSWPGNIRELAHFMENLMIRAGDSQTSLGLSHIPDYILNVMAGDRDKFLDDQDKLSLQDRLDLLERKIIAQELKKHYWNVKRTADHLGISRQSLIYRMKKLDIKRP